MDRSSQVGSLDGIGRRALVTIVDAYRRFWFDFIFFDVLDVGLGLRHQIPRSNPATCSTKMGGAVLSLSDPYVQLHGVGGLCHRASIVRYIPEWR